MLYIKLKRMGNDQNCHSFVSCNPFGVRLKPFLKYKCYSLTKGGGVYCRTAKIHDVIDYRVPTSSGNHGKSGESLNKFHAWKNHGI